MKTQKSIVLCAMIIALTVKGQNNYHKYYLEGQLCSGLQQRSLANGVGGAFGFFLNKNSSIDIRGREVYNFSDKTVVGAITATYRYNFNNGFYVGGGFGHHHEISSTTYACHPVESAMGTEKSIFHRSGLAAEIGYNFKPFASTGFFSNIYPTSNITMTFMSRDHGPNPLITANFGIKIGIKKWQ